MKSTELHLLILRDGWRKLRQAASHVIYEKEGKTYPVPYHGSKEVSKGIELKIRREMGLK